MTKKTDFRQVEPYVWELPKEHRPDMRVPARLFADEEMLEDAFRDKTADQLANTATLPGIVKYALAMPDFHQGYGFPIGGVAAMRRADGVISPGGVGYDINCGVRLMATQLEHDEVAPYVRDLTAALYQACPSGVGGTGRVQVSEPELEQLMEQGAQAGPGYGGRRLAHGGERLPAGGPAAPRQQARPRAGAPAGGFAGRGQSLPRD